MSRILLAAIAVVLLVAAPEASAASKPSLAQRLVGTWRLTSFDVVDGSGNVVAQPMGPKPVGKLTYTADRTMWALVARRGATKDGTNAVWYTGTFTVRGSTVTHHVDASNMPAAEGTDQVRRAKLERDRLTLSAGAAPAIVVLVWKRAR
jgi:hypothetical protein